MEGPYRDLGAGFARLAGPEGVRRSPSRIFSVEDALYELLRNSRDAGAKNIYVASTLRRRRYRTLTVLDDGGGIPESHKDLIFEPGVTTRHLNPTLFQNDVSPHGAGLSLHHMKNAAVSVHVVSSGDPTSITATFDTERIFERSLQSATRHSGSNLGATLLKFMKNTPNIRLYQATPAHILATLIKNRIIQQEQRGNSKEVREAGFGLGLGVSLRTVQRILSGEIEEARPLLPLASREGPKARGARGETHTSTDRAGAGISLEAKEKGEIATILRRMVQARYLDMGELRVEVRPGEISFKAHIFDLEDEYE